MNCGSGQLLIQQLQLPGGRILAAEQVLNARGELFAPGNCFDLPDRRPRLMALDPRAAAAQVIGDVLTGRSLSQALAPRLEQVAERERGLLQQLCYGTVRQAPRLQALLGQLLDKPLRDKDSDIQGLLLCGLYQLESTRIPDHAAVATTVSAAAVLKKPWARGMTNAVLRRFLRERDTLAAGLTAAAAACHPDWLYRKLLQQWPAAALDIIATNNQQPPMTLRVNTGRISRQAYLGQARKPGYRGPGGAALAAGRLPGETLRCVGVAGVYRGRGKRAGRGRATGRPAAAGGTR